MKIVGTICYTYLIQTILPPLSQASLFPLHERIGLTIKPNLLTSADRKFINGYANAHNSTNAVKSFETLRLQQQSLVHLRRKARSSLKVVKHHGWNDLCYKYSIWRSQWLAQLSTKPQYFLGDWMRRFPASVSSVQEEDE